MQLTPYYPVSLREGEFVYEIIQLYFITNKLHDTKVRIAYNKFTAVGLGPLIKKRKLDKFRLAKLEIHMRIFQTTTMKFSNDQFIFEFYNSITLMRFIL